MMISDIDLINNKLINALLIYDFCRIKKDCEILFPFVILPLVLNERYTDVLLSRGKIELYYLINRFVKSKGDVFYAEYHLEIEERKEAIFESVIFCLENKWIKFNEIDDKIYLSIDQNIDLKELLNLNIMKKNNKLARVCEKLSLEKFLIAIRLVI